MGLCHPHSGCIFPSQSSLNAASQAQPQGSYLVKPTVQIKHHSGYVFLTFHFRDQQIEAWKDLFYI